MQGCDHAQMSGSIVPLYLLMRVLSVQKYDSFPLSLFEAVIDPFSLSLNLGLKVGVALDTAAGRCTNLNEGKFALILWIAFEKRLNSLESFKYPFGIVHAVDAYAQVCRLETQLLKQRATLLLRSHPRLVQGTIVNEFNTDREWKDGGSMLVALDREVFPVNFRLEHVVHCIQEIVAVGLGVKANQVGSQQTIEQLALPGTDAECFGIRPWNVPEDSDSRVRQPVLEQAR